jgi:hypothetical protein
MRRIVIMSAMLIIAVAARGQSQVATATSSAPFTLRDAGITPGAGIPTWPVLAGDTVKAGSALTILTFSDGSVITLEPGSAGKIDFVNGKPSFQLVEGTARYSLKRRGAVVLLAGGQAVSTAALSGSLTLGSTTAAAAGFWTAGTIAAVVVGGAAAAGAAVGISYAVSGGAAVSPSK